MRRPVAVAGSGQTHYRTNRSDVSTPELVFEAVHRAFEDARVSPSDIEAVVFASAPEVFEGVHEPDLWCAGAFGGRDKPQMRIHTGGATGGSGALAGVSLVASGRFDSVLVVGLQRTGESKDAQQIFTTMFDPIYESDVQLNVITTVAMMAARHIEHFGLTEDHMAWISVKNLANASRNPYSHLKGDVTLDEVKSSRMIAWPLRLLHCCPRSDGAAAVVLLGGDKARSRREQGLAWVRGVGSATDVYRIGDRIDDLGWDFASQRALWWAAQKAYRMAGIGDPLHQLDVIEVYAPFSNIEVVTYEALGLTGIGRGWTLVEEEATTMTGEVAVCPSGGCMTSNPIGATGLVRFAEAAMQVSGRAGEHQVEGARTALATATGGINQFFTAAVLAADPD